MLQPLLLFVILFFASFTQSVAGFGLALAAMPFLTSLLGLPEAAVLLSLLGNAVTLPLLIRYRRSVDVKAVARLAAASLIAVPVGIVAVSRLDADIVTAALGVVTAGYALYALLSPRMPTITHPAWAYPFGAAAGLLGGAYATAGPPFIVYLNLTRADPEAFKGNLQGLFFLNGILQMAVHGIVGNFTPVVWRSLIPTLPGIALGIAAGLSLGRRIDPALFEKIVLALLVAVGIRLLF
jgi:uncharacterized membrane protein YfcA